MQNSVDYNYMGQERPTLKPKPFLKLTEASTRFANRKDQVQNVAINMLLQQQTELLKIKQRQAEIKRLIHEKKTEMERAQNDEEMQRARLSVKTPSKTPNRQSQKNITFMPLSFDKINNDSKSPAPSTRRAINMDL